VTSSAQKLWSYRSHRSVFSHEQKIFPCVSHVIIIFQRKMMTSYLL